jgi:hypothetical protein
MTKELKEQFNTIIKKIEQLEEEVKNWRALVEEIKEKKKVRLTPTYYYEPDTEVEIKKEVQEQIDDITKEAEEINRQIGYAVEGGYLGVEEAQNMSILQRKEWLERWYNYERDPY